MKLRYTRRANGDLRNISNYLVEKSPAGARNVRAAILEAVRILASHPFAGRRQTTQSVRKLVVRKYPYLVYYTVDKEPDEIIILSIQHPAREREHDDL